MSDTSRTHPATRLRLVALAAALAGCNITIDIPEFTSGTSGAFTAGVPTDTSSAEGTEAPDAPPTSTTEGSSGGPDEPTGPGSTGLATDTAGEATGDGTDGSSGTSGDPTSGDPTAGDPTSDDPSAGDPTTDAESAGDTSSGGATTAAPEPSCGDGLVDPGELCDDGINDGSYGGCAPGCQAPGPRCGDGEIQADELCDGFEVGAASCADLGHAAGVVFCTEDCAQLDYRLCSTCGDGAVNGAEACDGADLGGQSCESLGFPGGGDLACDASCVVDVSGCVREPPPCCAVDVAGACEVIPVRECVCADLPECCTFFWDEACVALAAACGASCAPPSDPGIDGAGPRSSASAGRRAPGGRGPRPAK